MSPIQVLIFSILLAYVNAQTDLKVCAKIIHGENCVQINRNDNIKCQIFPHNLDCLIGINNGSISFGAVTPDEAAIASEFLGNLKVVAEIRPEDEINDLQEIELVVLVKDQNVNSFKDLRNKKLCHPGYEKLSTVSNYALDLLEDAVLEAIDGKGCKSKDTLVENRISKLSEFFDESCKPGIWVHDVNKDKELKKKYAAKMCGHCDSTASDQCKLNSNGDPFKSAIECFKTGDIVITTTKEVRKLQSAAPWKYLCPDGKSSFNQCVWSRKPWNLIITSRKNFDSAAGFLKQTFYDEAENVQRKPDIKPYLKNVLTSDPNNKFQFTDKDLSEYMKEFKYSPEGEPNCDAQLKWCLTSDAEMDKCNWFQRAVRNQGILPGIGCVKMESRVDCLKQISKKKADIVTIDNNLGYSARKYGLKAIAFPETMDEVRSMIVVKNLQNNIALSNLKGKKGCFAEFADIAYISFFKTLNDSDLVKSSCDYGAFANEFLSESCVPGINEPDRKPTKITDVNKLCSICSSSSGKTAGTCAANYDNEYFRNEGALKCLRDGVGDFAVVSNRNVSESTLNSTDLIVICKNGTLAGYPGLKVDDACYLSITSSSELVVRSDYKYYNDSLLALSAFEVIFGQNLHKPFDLFGPFNFTLDLMFKDTTPGLNFIVEDNKYTENYVKLFNDFDYCIEGGNSGAVKIEFLFAQTMLLIILGYITMF